MEQQYNKNELKKIMNFFSFRILAIFRLTVYQIFKY